MGLKGVGVGSEGSIGQVTIEESKNMTVMGLVQKACGPDDPRQPSPSSMTL